MMQFFNFKKCNKPHWSVKDGQLLLSTETSKEEELAKQVVKVLEAQIRNQVAKEIMDWQPIKNRKQIIKVSGSIDAALLGVQVICADIALGKQNGIE